MKTLSRIQPLQMILTLLFLLILSVPALVCGQVPEGYPEIRIDLTTIEEDAFAGIAEDAKMVMIPENVVNISGNPFSGSGVKFIMGDEGSAAESMAAEYGLLFIPISD